VFFNYEYTRTDNEVLIIKRRYIFTQSTRHHRCNAGSSAACMMIYRFWAFQGVGRVRENGKPLSPSSRLCLHHRFQDGRRRAAPLYTPTTVPSLQIARGGIPGENKHPRLKPFARDKNIRFFK